MIPFQSFIFTIMSQTLELIFEFEVIWYLYLDVGEKLCQFSQGSFHQLLSKNEHFLQCCRIVCVSRLPSRELTYPPHIAYLKMIFLFPRWDMLIPWRVFVVSPPKCSAKIDLFSAFGYALLEARSLKIRVPPQTSLGFSTNWKLCWSPFRILKSHEVDSCNTVL